MGDPGATPLVSIGLAVYNGERYLEEAIGSILAQSYRNLELIISDNASTDTTEAICRRFVANDPRVRYYRNATNIGGANNENLTFTYARGKYFRWAAHDDVLAPTLIERCVELMEARPEVVLCHSRVVVIDAEGRPLHIIAHDAGSAPRPSERLSRLAALDHRCEETYGLMRAEILRLTGLQRNYTDSDRTLLVHMSLYGPFYELPEPLFYRRIHPGASTVQFADWRQRMYWFGDEYRGRLNLPYLAQLAHYLELITLTPLSLEEKLRCYGHIIAWVLRYRRWKWLGKDLVLAGQSLVRKLVWQR